MRLFYVLFTLLCLSFLELSAQTIPQYPNRTDAQGRRQGVWTILFDEDWLETNDATLAKFYRVISYKNDRPMGKVRDYYWSGVLQMEGDSLIRDRPEEVLHGTCIWYGEDGQIEEVEWYKRSKLEKNYYSNDWITLYAQGITALESKLYHSVILNMEQARKKIGRKIKTNLDIYITICKALAFSYHKSEKYIDAKYFFLKVAKLEAIYLGENDLTFALTCNNLAMTNLSLGLYQDALPLFNKAKKIIGNVKGKDNTDYISCCSNLSSIYQYLGKYHEAEKLYLEIKDIQEKINGRLTYQYAIICNGLAEVYRLQGSFEQAEKLFIESKGIILFLFSKNHANYTLVCNNLAVLYDDQGLYRKAEKLHKEVMNIREVLFGKNHPYYASSCANLALVYEHLGLYKKAVFL